MFSLEVSEYQDTYSREKNNEFLVEYSCTSAVFAVEIFWRKPNWLWLRIKSLNFERNHNKKHFLE